jgi:hypothetical protein
MTDKKWNIVSYEYRDFYSAKSLKDKADQVNKNNTQLTFIDHTIHTILSNAESRSKKGFYDSPFEYKSINKESDKIISDYLIKIGHTVSYNVDDDDDTTIKGVLSWKDIDKKINDFFL